MIILPDLTESICKHNFNSTLREYSKYLFFSLCICLYICSPFFNFMDQ